MIRVLGFLIAVVLVGSCLTACTATPLLANSVRSQVGDRGFAVAVIGASASAGPAVAKVGTAVTFAEKAHQFPGSLAKDFVGLGKPVRLRLGRDQQPRSVVTLKLQIDPKKVAKSDWSTPRTYGVLTQSAGSKTASLLPATYNASTRTLTAATTHLSWFQPVQLNASTVINTAVDAIATAYKLKFGVPSCAKAKASVTRGGYRYTLDSSWAASSCLSANSDALIADISSLTGLPFNASSIKEGTVRALPGLSTSGVLATGIYDALFGFHGSHFLAPGGKLRFRFDGSPPLKITFTQAPAMLLVAILIQTIQTVLQAVGVRGQVVETFDHLDKLDCMSSVVSTAQDARDRLDATAAGELVAAAISCIGTHMTAAPIAIIWALLTAAPTLFTTSILGVVTSLTGKGSFTLTLAAAALPPDPADYLSRFPGGDLPDTTVYAFDSPSHNIQCTINSMSNDRYYACALARYTFKDPPAPDHCDQHIPYGGLFTSKVGRAVEYPCHGGVEVPNAPFGANKILPQGARLSTLGVSCESTQLQDEEAVTCLDNSDGAGFTASASQYSVRPIGK